MARKKKPTGGIVPPLITDPKKQEELGKKLRENSEVSGPQGKVFKAPVVAREKFKNKPLEVEGKTVRAPKDVELKRGVTAVSTAPKRRRAKKQTPIAKPKPGQIAKIDGKLTRVTPETAAQAYEEKRKTVLPTAGKKEMTPAGRPEIEGAILPPRLSSSQNKKNLGGFAAKHSVVAKATHQALGHLGTMANTAKGSQEHHEATEAFNMLHGHIGQIGNKKLHKDLGLGRTIVQQHHGKPELAQALKIHRGIVLGRLEEGKIAEQSRSERAGGKAD